MAQQPLSQEIIDTITTRLVKTYEPLEIHLLEPRTNDDVEINIIVIVENAGLQQRYALMAEGHKALIGIKIPKNLLVYTKTEFEEYSADESTLSYSVKNYGKRIYAKA